MVNDIAIVKLERPVPISNQIYPICISLKYTLQAEKTALAIGYGDFRKNGDDKLVQEDRLRAISVPVYKSCIRDDLICTSSRHVGPEEVS